MVPWLEELSGMVSVCPQAVQAIDEKDPSIWWHLSERGDWMLYYIWGLGMGNCLFLSMEDLASHVKCPRDFLGIYVWSSCSVLEADLGRCADLAYRIRKIWPDLPLVV